MGLSINAQVSEGSSPRDVSNSAWNANVGKIVMKALEGLESLRLDVQPIQPMCNQGLIDPKGGEGM